MSDYLTKAKRPGSDEWEPVEMRDNYYGPHNYGVQFPDGHVYPDGDCEIIGEKPGETWEERYDVLVKKYVTEENMKAFIASEIQSAVEAERRRISEEVGKMYDRCTDWDALKEILSIIDPKE